MKTWLFNGVSRMAVMAMLRAFERAVKPPPGSVLHRDGTPVLACDLKILSPYRLERDGDYLRLVTI